ncbi:MAG: hypothetical protein KBD07_04580 [Candidatus Omnitrophica bacterium]|jgi:tetratricopeptide (TPR) repeat protein|nr:hypothetical protein [Candidatus Omnitrophota bacterium]
MKAFVLPLAAMLVTGAVGSPIGAKLILAEAPEKATLENPLFAALGSAKEAAGDLIYQRADEYFHGGMDRNMMSLHGEAHEDEDDPRYHAEVETTDWVMRVNSSIRIMEHRHLENQDSAEILPLLSMSTTLNPKNMDAALTAAYWLEKATGDVEKPIEVLIKASKADDRDWKAPFAIGELIFLKKKQPRDAVPYFEKAVSRLVPDNAMPFDWVRVRYTLAEALSASGETEKALERYRETLALAEQRPESALPEVLRQKIKALESNLASSKAPEDNKSI